MNTKNVIKMFSRVILPRISHRKYGYKVVKRPDISQLKYPNLATAPTLMQIIKEKIRLKGPITVAEYMHIVITNPTEGYYLKDESIGRQGDFITSPEMTQLFGEMLAIWFVVETRKMGAGVPLQLVELGPGNGTLLVDFLRVLTRVGYDASNLSLHLVEISKTMQMIQASKLCSKHGPVDIENKHFYEGETISGIKLYWYNDLQKVPQAFSWIVAHEFFDVMPIHKFEKTENGWRELLIDIDEKEKLYYRISAEETPAVKLLIRPPLDTGERTELEISGRSLGIARQVAERVDKDGGLCLIADYGHEGEKGDTFRAFHKHKVVHPLENPGTSDLTADVDFSQMRIAASMTPRSENHAIVMGPIKQMDFLKRLQADVRLKILMDNAKSEETRENLQTAYNTLVDPTKMGERFKFMAFYPSSMAELLDKNPPLAFSA